MKSSYIWKKKKITITCGGFTKRTLFNFLLFVCKICFFFPFLQFDGIHYLSFPPFFYFLILIAMHVVLILISAFFYYFFLLTISFSSSLTFFFFSRATTSTKRITSKYASARLHSFIIVFFFFLFNLPFVIASLSIQFAAISKIKSIAIHSLLLHLTNNYHSLQ